jgi:quercetin dioxygenase-like cupin family protein
MITNKFKKKVQYHPKESLILRPDVKGAKMWSVALEKTMLTFFSVDPESGFDKHSHVSEQITMVLKGELFFEVTKRIICVKKGEVIAIPSNIPHAVFTRDRAVDAVDAWSQPQEKYMDKQK